MTCGRSVFESHSWGGILDTTLCNNGCQWLVAGQYLNPTHGECILDTTLCNNGCQWLVAGQYLNPTHGEVYLIQHYVIMVVSDLWQVSIWIPLMGRYTHDTTLCNNGCQWLVAGQYLNPTHGEVYLIQHYVIMVVSDLWQVSIWIPLMGRYTWSTLCNNGCQWLVAGQYLNPTHGEVYLIQHYVIMVVSDLWQVSIWIPLMGRYTWYNIM